MRQAHVRPRLAGVGGLVDPIAHHITVANRPSFPGSGPDGAWIRRRDGQRADGRGGLLVEYWRPAISAVSGFPHAAGCRSCIVSAWISRHSGHSRYTIPNLRANKPEPKLYFHRPNRIVPYARTTLPTIQASTANSVSRRITMIGDLRRKQRDIYMSSRRTAKI